MAEKRKVGRPKNDPAAKRKASTPATPAAGTPGPETAAPSAVKASEGKPLPTVDEPQPAGLPEEKYRSISSRVVDGPFSGVLEAALEQSRNKWLTGEGIFERYWTKTSRKKDQPPKPDNNPPKNSMTAVNPKEGSCRLTAGPHVFDITLYAIKDIQPQAYGQLPAQRPVLQYGAPPGYATPNPPHHSSSYSPQYPAQISQAAPQHQPNTGRILSPMQHSQMTHQTGQPQPHGNPPAASGTFRSNPPPAHGAILPAPSSGAPRSASTSQQTTKPNPDPVIQMLAARAAEDPELKVLMKIVATGFAHQEQLKTFQRHIDELTAILGAQRDTPMKADVPSTNGTPGPAASGAQTNGNVRTNGPPPSGPGNTPQAHSTISTLSNGSRPIPTPPPSQSNQQFPQRSPQSDVRPIAIEFTSPGSNGDRFLFPRYSIIEYLDGGREVIASFLVVRKGSTAASGGYDPQLDYYEPITVRFSADDPRFLQPLTKAVLPQQVVREYMEDVMSKCTRAEYVHLAMRLPRDPRDELTMDMDGDGVTDRGVDGSGSREQSVSVGTPQEAAGLARKKSHKRKGATDGR
ncbi:hypothetical protein LTR04_005462 [Oleoguttula sp. CCFEE 6159]|nr:hypothetical protein LTR04_005462 [Oleoguttula sp. CCFEE 6159]